jgi:hypothetical protein
MFCWNTKQTQIKNTEISTDLRVTFTTVYDIISVEFFNFDFPTGAGISIKGEPLVRFLFYSVYQYSLLYFFLKCN